MDSFSVITELGTHITIHQHKDGYFVTAINEELETLKIAEDFQQFLRANKAVFHALHRRSLTTYDVEVSSMQIAGLTQCEDYSD